MDLVADSEADLAMKPEDLAAYRKLVAETGALFGARHYRQYHFLYTLSGDVGQHGLEHHESNDSAAAERTLLDPDLHMLYAALIPHEFAHSWNGNIVGRRGWPREIIRNQWSAISCGFMKGSRNIWAICWRSAVDCGPRNSIVKRWP